jgi:hypothetical protein
MVDTSNGTNDVATKNRETVPIVLALFCSLRHVRQHKECQHRYGDVMYT